MIINNKLITFLFGYFVSACSNESTNGTISHLLSSTIHSESGTKNACLLANGDAGMLEIAGEFCPKVEQKCIEWLPNINTKIPPARCAKFQKPSTCLSARRVPIHFYMDKFELPNIEGMKPQIGLSWMDVQKICESSGKRMCTDDEWTFACEGKEMNPYPYGYERDSSACNIDKEFVPFNEQLFINTKTRFAEFERVSQSVPSGSMLRCKSVFEVFDQTGNVDEATINTSGIGFKNALKGGAWGRIRGRCRPATTAHSTTYFFYQSSGRCCADYK